MPAVGHQRWRFLPASGAQQRPGPGGIDHGRDHADGEAERSGDKPRRRNEAVIGTVENHQRSDADKDADDHRRKIFGLVVAIGQRGVRRLLRQAHRHQRHHGGDNVDDAFQCIREERQRTGRIGREGLERQHGETHGKTAKSDSGQELGIRRAHFRAPMARPALRRKRLICK